MNKKKNIWVGVSFLAVILFSCDFYKEDTSLSDVVKVPFLPNQPVLISLKSKLNLENASSYELVQGPTAGKIQMINNQFAIYTPGQTDSENVSFRLRDVIGNEIGNGRIQFEKQEGACGIAQFDRAEIRKDSSLHINLANNDRLCSKMAGGVVSYIDLENSDGFIVGISSSSLDMNYKAPAGFTGTAKVIYIAGLNLKKEYEDMGQLPSYGIKNAQDLIDHSYMFEYFVTSIAEVVVHD
jgi:hypothetical protein